MSERIKEYLNKSTGFPIGSLVKNLPASVVDARDISSIPGSGRSLGEEMATHSSILAWKITWTEEPGGQYSPWVHKESDMTERAHTNKLKVHIQDENAHYSKDSNSPQIDL